VKRERKKETKKRLLLRKKKCILFVKKDTYARQLPDQEASSWPDVLMTLFSKMILGEQVR